MALPFSEFVRPFVRPCVPFFYFVSLESEVHFEVSRVFHGCFKDFMSLSGCFKGVSRLFQGCFKDVSWVFQVGFKGVSKVFQGCFKGVSRTFQGYFKGV